MGKLHTNWVDVSWGYLMRSLVLIWRALPAFRGGKEARLEYCQLSLNSLFRPRSLEPASIQCGLVVATSNRGATKPLAQIRIVTGTFEVLNLVPASDTRKLG